MDKSYPPLMRYTSYLLIYLTACQPLHPAFAAGIEAANSNTQVVIKPENVPVINIATPNGAGISHNTYKDFNVGVPGAVLNNGSQGGKTQLGVTIENGNPNLKGKSAELIINEVTGGSRSELQGKVEVFGNKANVMIANPNGITCDGCGFINTSGATLTTGKPQFDKQGALEALEVKKGSVIIGEKGFDATGADYVDIISRATEINGKINANNLSLTQGANRISYRDGTVTRIEGEDAKPQLAVDTKALGGMYANKIRLVASEDGVGVNLKELESKQQDITLSVNGTISLNGNTHSKTNLNLSAREIHVTPGTTAQGDGDVTLAAVNITNDGQVTTSGDMHIFGDHIRNAGESAKLHANKNMWIQKDAQGNKAQSVENRSAKILTNTGDLVIRTEKLDNVRNETSTEWKNIPGDSTAFHPSFVGSYYAKREGVDAVVRLEPDISSIGIDKWFGEIDLSLNDKVNVGRDELVLAVSQSEGLISSGNNAYINATALWNDQSTIRAANDLILTGNNFSVQSAQFGQKDKFWRLGTDAFGAGEYILDEDAPLGDWDLLYVTEKTPYSNQQEITTWQERGYQKSSITAGKSLVADFNDTVNIYTAFPYDAPNTQEVILTQRPDTLSAQNILLHANKVIITDTIKSGKELNVLADESIVLGQGALHSDGNISLLSTGNIDAWQSEVKGGNVTVVSRNGEVKFHTSEAPRYYFPDNARWLTELTATGDLTVSAGKNIYLRNTLLSPKSNNIIMTAGQDITVEKNDALFDSKLLTAVTTPEREQEIFNQLLQITQFNASGSVSLTSGTDLILRGAKINADKDVSLLSNRNIDLRYRPIDERFNTLFADSRTPELISSVHAGGNLLISAARDIDTQGGAFSANGNASLLAGQNLLMTALGYSAIDAANDNNKDDRHLVTTVNAGNNFTAAANGQLLTYGSTLTSGGNMTLTSGGDMRFEAVQNHTYREEGNEYTESSLQQGTEMNAGGVMTIISNGSILFQAAKLAANTALDVAAQGGYLYAQAMEESSHYEKTTKKRKWWGKKTEVTRTRHDVTNKVTEFTANGNIDLMSRDDSTYEASKIAAGENARLTSTQGQINFRAVKDTTFEQTISNSKGFFIRQSNKGYEEDKWVLPGIHAGGALTINAAEGISADVKVQNGQILTNAVSALGNAPGTDWLKDLNTRDDVQWNTVKDAYDSWNYKSQSLNPVVAAVIAIAAAAATAGAGLAAAAGSGAVTASGVTGATATSMVYGAGYAGMTSLVSQAAVALVENQGNLSNTLQALGSSDTVKATATSMAIGGALAGFDQVLDAGVAADKARLPALINDEGWSKIAQRVAGQSVISSSLNTAINGGDFKDHLTTALLTNIGSQLQAEGANLIGDNGEVLGVAGKSVSHAVLAGISAEIARGDGKGAAAGALAAELAGVAMQNSLFEPANLNEQERQLLRLQEALNGNEAKEQTARVIGALAGALVSHTAEGTNSGADSAQNVYRYNMTDHMLEQYSLDNQRDILAADQGDEDAARRVQARREAGVMVAVVGGGGLVLAAGGITLAGAAPELVLAARLVIASCKTNPALCLNQAGIYAADIVSPEAIIGTGALTAGSTLILGKTAESAKNLSQQLVKTSDDLIRNKALNTQPVADFIRGEAATGSTLSTTTADYIRDVQKNSMDQLVRVFDPKQNESKLTVFGKQFEQVLGDGGSNKQGNTKVFATENLSQQDIFDYVQSLTGGKPLVEIPTAPGRYYVELDDGSKFNLRSFSTSKEDTKARWTLDILKNDRISELQGKVKKPVEIKFR